MAVALTIQGKLVQWSQDVVTAKLNNLSNLSSKSTAWIQSDLSLSPSNCLTRLIWWVVAKFFLWIRETFYQVNLDQSQAVLNQIRNNIQPKDNAAVILFNKAVLAFNSIAPRHIVQTIEPLPTYETAESLIVHFESCWKPFPPGFEGIDYDQNRLLQRLESYNKLFASPADPMADYGFIEKIDIPPGSRIFVRADLHGDLRSLLSNLKALQEQGLLDEHFRCIPGFYFVILGDYMDRGTNSLQIAELLALLKMENPTQVHYIRGNHEYTFINQTYCGNDPNFKSFLFDEGYQERRSTLVSFYQTMPLTLYMGEDQYVQFTHGLFELTTDPAPLLDTALNRMPVSKQRKLSERIAQIPSEVDASAPKKQQKLVAAANRIRALIEQDANRPEADGYTMYNWGDVQDATSLGSPGNRTWHLNAADVQHYLRLSGTTRKVKMVFRGHQHLFQHASHNSKTVVSTLPVGMDSAYKDYYPFAGQPDRAYILTTAPKVKDWKKTAILRYSGQTKYEIFGPAPIRSIAI